MYKVLKHIKTLKQTFNIQVFGTVLNFFMMVQRMYVANLKPANWHTLHTNWYIKYWILLSIQPTETASDTNFESAVPRDQAAIHYEAACNRIAIEAVKRGSSDNVSVMLIEITKQ